MNLGQSFVFGLTLAISIGPIALMIIHYGISYGRKTAMLSGLGAALADFTYALVGFTSGYGISLLLGRHRALLSLCSALVLVGIGLYLIVSAIRSLKNKEAGGGQAPARPVRAMLTTYFLTVLNPLTILLFVAFAGDMQASAPLEVLANALAVFLGSVIIQLSLALFGSLVRSSVSRSGVIPLLNVASGTGIILFGISRLL